MMRGYDQWKTASPWDQFDDPACEVCGVDPADCKCPTCAECGVQAGCDCHKSEEPNEMRFHWCYWAEQTETRKGTRTQWVTHAFAAVDPNDESGVRRALCGAVRPAAYKMAGTSGGECAECLSIIECADPECDICLPDDGDPTPWCHVCHADDEKDCDCLPIAENN